MSGAHSEKFILGLDHVAIAVTDLERAIKWYCGGLGFEVGKIRETRGKHSGMISAVLTSGSVVVVLVQGTEKRSQVSRFVEHFGPGVQHYALLVSDLDEALRRLSVSDGVADTRVIRGDGIRQVFLRRDAGCGTRVELIERRGGDFTDQTIQELFQEFEDHDLY
jgi:methylmalonyl-CoA/ethylmalonyl-CoA epimerase